MLSATHQGWGCFKKCNDFSISISSILCFRSNTGMAQMEGVGDKAKRRGFFLFLSSPRPVDIHLLQLHPYIKCKHWRAPRYLLCPPAPGYSPVLSEDAMPYHKWCCCMSAAWTSRQKPPLLHRLVITTCLHLPASHRMIALYLTKSWSYFLRLAFSTYKHGWDYTAADLEIQSKLNRLLTHSIAANMAAECLATFSSTAHPERVGLYLLHSGFLQPACASALGFQPFTGSFSKISLHPPSCKPACIMWSHC